MYDGEVDVEQEELSDFLEVRPTSVILTPNFTRSKYEILCFMVGILIFKTFYLYLQ